MMSIYKYRRKCLQFFIESKPLTISEIKRKIKYEEMHFSFQSN